MPCHASRSSNTAKSMHVSHIIGGHGRSTRGGVAAVEGRHRLNPYHTHTHTIYPSVAFVIIIPSSQRQVLPPLQSSLHAHTRTYGVVGALRGASSITTVAQGQIRACLDVKNFRIQIR